jgi:endonuclease YncB( thermonuclease family)
VFADEFPELSCRARPVQGQTDGDTISIMHASRPVKIRVEGIDCPELCQALEGHKSQLFY